MFSKVVPLSKDTHGDWSLQMDGGYDFARTLRVIPLVLREIPAASRELPVVFRREGDRIRPAALVGLTPGVNCMVDTDGRWRGSYVPAILRQYPFAIGRVKGSKDGLLSIDQAYAGLNQKGHGRRLFDDKGEATELLTRARDFALELSRSTAVTAGLCDAMQEMDILKPMNVAIKTPAGESISICGVLVADREKLKALPSDKLALLLKTNCLEVIFLHLRSLENIRSLVQIAAGKSDGVELPDVDPPDPEEP